MQTASPARKDILQLTEHLDDYVILPGCGSAQSIGKYLVGCGAFPVPEKLIGYINYEAVGTEFLRCAWRRSVQPRIRCAQGGLAAGSSG